MFFICLLVVFVSYCVLLVVLQVVFAICFANCCVFACNLFCRVVFWCVVCYQSPASERAIWCTKDLHLA